MAIASGLLVLAIARPAAGWEATVSVDQNAYISMDGGTTRQPMNVVYTNAADGSKMVTATGFAGSYDALFEDHVASFRGEATSGPGVIRAYAHGVALNFSHRPNIPPLAYAIGVVGGVAGIFKDSVVVSNSNANLKMGDPVKFRLVVHSAGSSFGTYRVGGQWDSTGYFPGRYALSVYAGLNAGVNYIFPNGLFQQVPDNLTFDIPIEVDAKVGESVAIYCSFGVGVEERAGKWANGANYINVQESIVDASHTIRLNIDAITPGITLHSESGHEYATPPPVLSFTQVTLAGSTLVVTGTNGPSNATFQILSSENAAAPLSDWTIQSTNSFDGAGGFRLTNEIGGASSRKFYTVRLRP